MISAQQIKQMQSQQLIKLIGWVGGQSRLAAELGQSKQTVHAWVKRGRISASAAILVDEKTCGMFKKSDLRPDVISWEK